MTTLLRATNDLVATAWLQIVLDASGGVGTMLPGDQASWAKTGFVQHAVIGGSADPWSTLHSPVYEVNCWSVAQNSRQPPWALANQLAERIRYGCFGQDQQPVSVALPPGYPGAAIRSARVLQEPRRVPGDLSSFGRYQFDLQMFWTETP